MVEEQIATEDSVIQTIPEDGHYPYKKEDDPIISAATKKAAPELDERKKLPATFLWDLHRPGLRDSSSAALPPCHDKAT